MVIVQQILFSMIYFLSLDAKDIWCSFILLGISQESGAVHKAWSQAAKRLFYWYYGRTLLMDNLALYYSVWFVNVWLYLSKFS